MQQVLGRNLEGTITKAEGIKKEWKDDFTSVEHAGATASRTRHACCMLACTLFQGAH